jgi:hypothetical protein
LKAQCRTSLLGTKKVPSSTNKNSFLLFTQMTGLFSAQHLRKA